MSAATGQARRAGRAGQAGRALLLLGSPRQKSVSASLGGFLLDQLAGHGLAGDILPLTGLLEAQEGRARLVSAVASASVVVLAAPVYVDAPPAAVLRAMEFLAGAPLPPRPGGPRLLAAVVNCGFPEAAHTAICLDIYRLFARSAGFTWAGGLGVGGGGALHGKPLSATGGMGRHVRQGLELAAAALAHGAAIPPEARERMARPVVSRPLYLLVAQIGWLAQAWKRRTLFKLGNAPFRTP